MEKEDNKTYDWVEAIDAKMARILRENIEDGLVKEEDLIGGKQEKFSR